MKEWQLRQRQSLPLQQKILMTKRRIRNYYDHFDGDVYLSYSGGKDSEVLRQIIKEMKGYTDITNVFCQTGLQLKSVREKVLELADDKDCFEEQTKYGYTQRFYSNSNLVVLKPKMDFRETILKYGYPVVSKEQAQFIYEYNNTTSDNLRSTRWQGNKNGNFKISEKWKFLVDVPFDISDKCCDIIKKRPFKRYEHEFNQNPIIATLANESMGRKQKYLQGDGCNVFDCERPHSNPMSFWTEQDVLEFIHKRDINLPEVYGEAVREDGVYKTTHRSRTGCAFCLFGIDQEEEPNRIQKLKKDDPQMYQYCMDKLRLGEIMEFMNIPYK